MDALMNPKSIAVIGASQRATRGTNVLNNLRQTGYKGGIYGINPRYEEVAGYPCYPKVSAVPDPVDCVVVAIPGEGVPEALEDAFAAGTKAAVVFSSGFGEGGGAHADRVRRLRDLVAKGMFICGPNCYGLLNARTGIASFSGPLPTMDSTGPAAVVSQSGGFAVGISEPLVQLRRVGASYIISCGNQIGASIEDYMEYLLEDPTVRIITVYAEDFRKPHRLETIGARSHKLDKPIVVLKGGRTAAGAAAARSHTGALAGSWEILSSMLQRYGFVQVEGLEAAIEVTAALAVQKSTSAFTREIVVLSLGGGDTTRIADAASEAGVGLSTFSADTTRRLEALLPDFGAARNPVDGTGVIMEKPELFPAILDAILADPQTGLIALPVSGTGKPLPGYPSTLEFIVDAGAQTEKPMLTYGPSTLVTASLDVIALLQDCGVPYVAGTERALEVISALHDYRQHQHRFRSNDDKSVRRPTIAMRPDLPAGVLPFMTAREILTEFGVPVVATELATTREEAVEAAAKLGCPVALKVEAGGLTHKSDIGGVALGCGDAAGVVEAFDRTIASVRRAGFTDVSGVLVQPMCMFGVETIAGVSVDPVLGPGLLFGLGGVFVEVLKDTVTEVPPLSLERAKEVVLSIHARKILEGVRGQAPADIAAVASVLVALGDFALVYRDRLTAVDVNPLLVGEAGTGAVAVDLVVELNDRGA